MFNKNSKKVLVALGLSTALMGMSLAPLLAHAHGDKGLHLGLGLKMHGEAKMDNDRLNNSLDIDDDMSVSGLKDAKITLNKSIKEANTAFKTSKKSAKVQLKVSMNAATSEDARVAAIKTYFASILAAFKTKNAAIEAAFQAFINTNFTANQAPVANAQSVTVAKNSSANITLTGSDPEASALSYILISSTTHGALSGATPHLIYTPSANFTGSDSFAFKVNDGSLTSAPANVSITVNP